MFFAEPPRTQWDIHFRLLGIPVRISPFFWVICLLLGFNLARDVAEISGGRLSIGVLLLIWTLAVTISILVHEFGHALAFRFYGAQAHVVLYQFGGLAIPHEQFGYGYGGERWQQPGPRIVTLIAGPGAQFLLGIGVMVGVHLAGYRLWNPLPFVPWLDFLEEGRMLSSLPFFMLVYSLSASSIWWALLNLIPVYPLDGGQIAREAISIFQPREGIRYSLILSVAAGGAAALWGFTRKDPFLGIMFALLAYQSYMTLKAYLASRGGYGDQPW